jgi:hypothetical protein
MRLKLFTILLLIHYISSFSIYSAYSRTLYVDSQNGSDLNDGSSPGKAWQTLLHAANEIQPGDKVKVAPGVYRGGIQINVKGRPDAPIIFEGDRIEGSTIITLADADIRERKRSWHLEDKKTGLYSITYNGGMPARVLYSGIDLYPYGSIKALNTFSNNNGPGPKHGHYFDPNENKLYVRLHASGQYGSNNPSDHLMAVAPPTGSRFDGTLVSQPHHYGIGIMGAGDAHVIIDGFTFETPGVAGVYTEANFVNIKHSWFQGCRTGVAGNYKDRTTIDPKGNDYYSLRYDPGTLDLSASHITIEYCDYHQKPSFDDAVDLIKELMLDKSRKDQGNRDLYIGFWHRKSIFNGLPSELHKYEIGLAARIGSDWIIRNNYVHDAFEGLSCHSVSASRYLVVENNLFERLLDNAVETEDHARNMFIHRNLIVDVFMPFSWQPIRGTPWPHSIYFTENIIYNTPKYQNVWKDMGFEKRGAFKIGVKAETWKRIPHMVGSLYAPVRVPGDGIILANNTVLFPGGSLIELQGGRDMPLYNVHFINNIIDTDYLYSINPESDLKEDHFNFNNNSIHFFDINDDRPARIVAGRTGKIAKTPNADNMDKNFMPLVDNEISNGAIEVPNFHKKFKSMGAIQTDNGWYPIKVGPQTNMKINITSNNE